MQRERTARIALAVVAAAFLVANLVNALHKGGDFDDYVAAAGRLLSGTSLYEGSGIGTGFVGPPAQAVLFLPFTLLAGLDPRVARVAWYAVNLGALWYALTVWTRTLGHRGSAGAAAEPRRPAWLSTDTLLALAAVGYPLQTQFEHQNLNVVLLALAAHAAEALQRGRSAKAGVALGAAAALKVYPALAVVWLAARRSWVALGTAAGAAAVVTMLPMASRGFSGFIDDFAAWRGIAAEGWPVRRANQSLTAMWGRYLLDEGPSGYPTVTADSVVIIACVAVTAAMLLVPLLIVAHRRRSGRSIAAELAVVNATAALLSPIAWEHYWVAWFPVFLALRVRARDGASTLPWWLFWGGAVLVSGLSRPTVGWHAARVVRAWSLMTWGGLLTCAGLTLLMLRDGVGTSVHREGPGPSPHTSSGERP